MASKVVIYTDGACAGNPGPGGWGAILIAHKGGEPHEKELSGGDAVTTNNRMELQAAIEGLRALTRPCEEDLYTDSQYVMKGITEWLPGWIRKGWKSASGKAVKNQDLWQALAAETDRHQVRWHWVKGHNGDPLNERVDQLAVAAIPRRR
jgi:ribonuclease HI